MEAPTNKHKGHLQAVAFLLRSLILTGEGVFRALFINSEACGWAVEGATLRASRADVRGGRTSEARPGSPVESGEDGSEDPRIPMRGMGGAVVVRRIVTAARRARTGASSTAQPTVSPPPSYLI